MASQLKPNLALMDVQLDGQMDGIEVAGLIGDHLRIPICISRVIRTKKLSAVRPRLGHTVTWIVLQILFPEPQSRGKGEMAGDDAAVHRRSGDCGRLAGCVKFINPAAEAMTGWDRTEAIGREISCKSTVRWTAKPANWRNASLSRWFGWRCASNRTGEEPGRAGWNANGGKGNRRADRQRRRQCARRGPGAPNRARLMISIKKFLTSGDRD